MGRVIADQSISLDGFSAGPNVRIGNGMGDRCDDLHTWMWSGGGPEGRDGSSIDGPQELVLGRVLRQLSGAPFILPAHATR